MTLTGAGTVVLQASQAADANYTANTQLASFTAAKFTPTITSNPTATAITYGQTLASSTLSNGVASAQGTFTFTAPSTQPNAGTAAQQVTFTPTDTANYNTVSLTVPVTVNKALPTITTNPTASAITYGQPLSTSTLGGGVTSTPGTFTFNQPNIKPNGGTASQNVTFTPTDAADYSTVALTVPVTVNKAAATVSLNGLSATYKGTSQSVTVTTDPANLNVAVTYNGSTSSPTQTGSYNVVATVADSSYSGTATSTFVIAPATAAITLAVPNHTYGDAPFAVNANSSSPVAFTYSVVSGPATLSGNTVTLTGTGVVTLQAAQAADANYNSNTQTASFTVNMAASPTVTFAAVATHTYGDAPFNVSASSRSTGAITYSVDSGPANISGNTVTLTGAGSVTLKASQAADTNYNASSGTATFQVGQAFSPPVLMIGSHTYGDAPFMVSATSASTGAITYSVLSGPATLSGNVVTLTGAGTVVLQASQAADANYKTNATTASFTVAVAVSGATLGFVVPAHVYGDAPFAVRAGSASTGAVTYTVVSGPAAISGNVVTLTGAGTVVLQATQAADANYAATTQQASFAVAPAVAVLAFAQPAPVVYGTALGIAQLNASVTAAGVGAVPGSFLYSPALGTVLNVGTAPLTAQFTPSNPANFTSPAAVTTTLTVVQAQTATVVTTSASPVLERAPVTFTATIKTTAGGTVPAGLVTFSDGATVLGTATLNASGVATVTAAAGFTGTGDHTISATYSGNANQAGSIGTVTETVGSASTLVLTDAGQASYTAAVQRGLATQTTVTLTPGATFEGTVTFSCSGLPTHAGCDFTPASVTLVKGSGPQQISLLIRSESLKYAKLHSEPAGTSTGARIALAFGFPWIALMGFGATSKRFRGSNRLMLGLLCLAGMGALTGCGSGTPLYTVNAADAGTYSFTVLATSGNSVASLPVTLTVQ